MRFRKIAFSVQLALIACFASQAKAQESFNEYLAYEVIPLSKLNDRYQLTIRFKNTQGYDPSGFYSIQALFVSPPGCTMFCNTYPAFLSTSGAVDQRPIAVGNGEVLMPDGPYSWGASSSGYGSDRWIGPGFEGHYSMTHGVLGCTRPGPTYGENPAPMSSPFYTARTCDAEGYNGWVELGVDVFLDPDAMWWTVPPTVEEVAAATFVGSRGYYLATNVYTTPEPGTVVLLGAGIVGIAVVARRRQFS